MSSLNSIHCDQGAVCFETCSNTRSDVRSSARFDLLDPFSKFYTRQIVKTSTILRQLSTPVTFVLPSFQTTTIYRKSNTNLLCIYDCVLSFTNLLQFSSLISVNEAVGSCEKLESMMQTKNSYRNWQQFEFENQ